jgi:hypothetical protein
MRPNPARRPGRGRSERRGLRPLRRVAAARPPLNGNPMPPRDALRPCGASLHNPTRLIWNAS